MKCIERIVTRRYWLHGYVLNLQVNAIMLLTLFNCLVSYLGWKWISEGIRGRDTKIKVSFSYAGEFTLLLVDWIWKHGNIIFYLGIGSLHMRTHLIWLLECQLLLLMFIEGQWSVRFSFIDMGKCLDIIHYSILLY